MIGYGLIAFKLRMKSLLYKKFVEIMMNNSYIYVNRNKTFWRQRLLFYLKIWNFFMNNIWFTN